MTLLHAILLGIIQGLTEFLPVSSSGHLVLAQALFNISDDLTDKAIYFDLTLHMGTVFAVLYCYWGDIKNIVGGIFKRNPENVLSGKNLIWMFVISIIATAIIALPFEKFIKDAFENPVYAALGLIATSIILAVSLKAKGNFKITDITSIKAFLIGIGQGIATLPGVSRSGITIVTSMFLGLSPKEAARYSFLLSVPTIILASIVQGLDALKEGSLNVPGLFYISGFLVSMIFGIIAIKALVRLLERSRIAWFALYCFPVGVITFFLVR